MALSTQPYKGARDFYPADKRILQYLFDIMIKTVESYGYEAYDAPLLEPIELYTAKTSDEIVNEQTYSFTDHGGRQVVIRPEMTPSVSRMVAAKRQELPYPLRWYSIPNVWRYERPQRGRLREHWQLNVDLFGVEGLEAEHEMISVVDSLLRAYGADRSMYSIRLNSRKLMDLLMHEYFGLDETQSYTIGKLIDRMHKIETAEFIAQADIVFTPQQRDAGQSSKLFELLSLTSLDQLPEQLHTNPVCMNLQKLMAMLEQSGITNVQFDPTIMRGFDYYTDIVFEVIDTNPDNNRSMLGGGRYDSLIGLFGVDPVPTIGFGAGDVTLQNFLVSHDLLPHLSPKTDVYVILVGDVFTSAQPIIKHFRDEGVNVAVDSTGRKAEKQIRTADKAGIPAVIFIGDTEIVSQQLTLKHLASGDEQTHSIDRLISIIKDSRHP
jgi:histidyl-tRNA synthetase